MIALNIEKVDNFVSKLQRKGVHVRWSGWDLVFLTTDQKTDRKARSSVNGRRWGDVWGFETRVSPNEDGMWLINYRLARGANA